MSVRSPASTRRGAIISAELLFVMPILAAIVMAIVEFSQLWTAQHLVQSAAAAGCRVASYPGATPAAVQAAVAASLHKNILVSNCEVSVSGGLMSGDDVVVSIAVPQVCAAPDLLRLFGYSLQGRILTAQCVMRKE